MKLKNMNTIEHLFEITGNTVEEIAENTARRDIDQTAPLGFVAILHKSRGCAWCSWNVYLFPV